MSVKIRKWFELPRGMRPDEEWFERAQEGLRQNPDLMSRGFEDRLEEAAYNAGYAFGQTGKPFYRKEMKVLHTLGQRHGKGRKVLQGFEDGQKDGKESGSRSAALRAELTRLAHEHSDLRSLLVPLLRGSDPSG